MSVNQEISAEWGTGKVNDEGRREFPTLNDFSHDGYHIEFQNAGGEWETFSMGSGPDITAAAMYCAAEAKRRRPDSDIRITFQNK